jgi:hypothetical protein
MNKEQEIKQKLDAHREQKAAEQPAQKTEGSPKTFTQEELTKIETIKQTYDQVMLRMGQIVFEEKAMLEEKKNLQSVFDDTRKNEIEFAQQLNTKYGKGTLDIQTGIFTPVE